MKVEITKQVPQVETIDIEIPYFYKHNLYPDSGEYCIFGKIEEKKVTTIQEVENHENDSKSYEIEVENFYSIKNSGLSSYLEKEHESNEQEFKLAQERCLIFLNSL